MKIVRSSLGCVAAGAALLLAGAAGAVAIVNPTNSSALSFGSPFAFEVGQWLGSAKDDEKSGVDSQVAEVYAPEGETRIYVQGAALKPYGESGVVALVWYLQTPNQVKRKEDTMKVSQKTDVAFAIRLYASQADFDNFQPDCYSGFFLLDSCEGSARIKDKNDLKGKFDVKCKDVDASAVATRFLDPEEPGNLFCPDVEEPSQETLTDLIGSFLDNGKLRLRVKDDAGVRTNESLVID